MRARYREQPSAALVVDQASIESQTLHDPLHGCVRTGSSATVDVNYAVHRAIGGLHDGPVPGDLLCAALASCQESSLRMVANVYGVRIEEMSVHVHAEVDVRGTLGMDPRVPVGFQNISVKVRVRTAKETSPQRLRQFYRAAERACVVLQTLRNGVPVSLSLDGAVEPGSPLASPHSPINPVTPS